MQNSKLYGEQLGSALPAEKEIPAYAYQYRADFIALQIGGIIEKIGKYAFGRCMELISVAMEDSVKEISAGTFFDCRKLEYVELSNSITTIPEKCFAKCKNLKEIILPQSIKRIEKGAFSDCDNLEKISIPIGATIENQSLPNNFKYVYVNKNSNTMTLSKELLNDTNAKKYNIVNKKIITNSYENDDCGMEKTIKS